MPRILKSDHISQIDSRMKTEQTEVLESPLSTSYIPSSQPGNGRGMGVLHPYPVAVEIDAPAGLSRELAYRRYQHLIGQVANPATGLVLHPAFDKPATAYGEGWRILWRKLCGEWIISPLFLLSSLAVILLFPEKLVKKITAPFTNVNFWEQFGKRAFDFVGAIAGFIVSSIFLIVVPIIIKLDSKGSVFYGQQRAGVNNRQRDRRQVNIAVAHDRRVGERRQRDLYGRPFTVFKFRTMRADAEKNSGAVWAQKNDPRTTRVGRILRFIHVDEIPQFFNVLCGEMSLVGPRPERPEIMTKLVDDIPQFPERLQVKPGITGIAQIYVGYDATIEDAREKLRYDLMYVKNSSLKADITIMLKTLWMIIRGRQVVKP